MPMNSESAFAQTNEKKNGSGLKRISKEYLEMGNKVYLFVL